MLATNQSHTPPPTPPVQYSTHRGLRACCIGLQNITDRWCESWFISHMSVRQLSMNGWLVTVTQVAEADGCWWLFQIATGFADIPRIVRIFSELCEYFQNCVTNIGPNYSAGPLPNIADVWFCKIQHHFSLSCIRRTILNFLNFNELHIQTWFDKKCWIKICAQKLLCLHKYFKNVVQWPNCSKKYAIHQQKIAGKLFLCGQRLPIVMIFTMNFRKFTITNKFLAKSFAVVSTS